MSILYIRTAVYIYIGSDFVIGGEGEGGILGNRSYFGNVVMTSVCMSNICAIYL